MIELEGVPELVDPVMVAAFEGWNDAGDAASAAVAHMEREWKGEVFAALDAEDYYDFQVNRPQVWLDGGSRKITWPTTRLAVVRVDNAGGKGRPRDLVLVRGIEPSMRWRSFCNEILGFAHELGVEMVVVMGALLGDTPHSRPVPVTGVTSDPDLARTMNLEESRYEGPTGIVGILQEACTHAGVPAVSLWASVPHYVSQPPNPKATLALLNRLEDLLKLNVPLGELQEDARAWQLGVDQLAAEDSEVAEYVQSLEEARDTAELPEASGEAIAKEFERYLRRRDDGPGTDDRSRPPRQPSRGGTAREDRRDGGKDESDDGDGEAAQDRGDGGDAENSADGEGSTGEGAAGSGEDGTGGAAGEGGSADTADGEDGKDSKSSKSSKDSQGSQGSQDATGGKDNADGTEGGDASGDKPAKSAKSAKSAKTAKTAKSAKSAAKRTSRPAKRSSTSRGGGRTRKSAESGGEGNDGAQQDKPAEGGDEKPETSADGRGDQGATGTGTGAGTGTSHNGKGSRNGTSGQDGSGDHDGQDATGDKRGKGSKGGRSTGTGRGRRKKTDGDAPGDE